MIGADPGRAAHALEVIEAVGTEATQGLARLLAVLRPENTIKTENLGPFPGLDDIDALVSNVESAGVHVSTLVTGNPRKLDISVGHAAYRVVQEALTNVTKHAGPGTHVTVTITWGQDSLNIVVSDDGAGHPAAKAGSSGFGLLGLRERVAVAGGDVSWRSQDGGFIVDSTIPLEKT